MPRGEGASRAREKGEKRKKKKEKKKKKKEKKRRKRRKRRRKKEKKKEEEKIRKKKKIKKIKKNNLFSIHNIIYGCACMVWKSWGDRVGSNPPSDHLTHLTFPGWVFWVVEMG